MTRPLIKFGVALMTLGLALPAHAADFSDPTWPCVQRKVERLSVGIMWPHPIEEVTFSPEIEADIEELVGRFVLRRIALEELEPEIAAFTEVHGSDLSLLGHVFAETFERMARTRTTIMHGIEDYSLSQIALAEQIEATRVKMNALMEADEPDFDQVDALEEKLDWDERIFTDRARSLTYVCETPVLLEKRLYAIAQMLLAEVDG